MATWREALKRPAGGPVEDWLAALCARLLVGTRFVVAGEPHRLVEVEAYYFAPDHLDPFTHRDPIQREPGLWYFHKTGGQYRSGSFKGIDLTFGDGTAHGGILFRGLETPDGRLVDGPSLLVDHLLARTGTRDVPTLDRALARRAAWDPESPLRLEAVEEPARTVYPTARVGLSFRRVRPTPANLAFLLRPYRLLTEPGRTAKGKVQMILALHRQGRTPEEIRAVTRSPAASVRRYLDAFAEGIKENDPGAYAGVVLGARELARLHGMGSR
jgi:hypothetical protein